MVWRNDEDSIIPFVPFLRGQAAKALAHYTDSLVLNGDTTATATGNINTDDGAPAGGKHYLAFDGLRHAGLVDATATSTGTLIGASLDTADLMAAKGRLVDYTYLHDWGHPTNPQDLVYVADPATADKIAAIADVQNSRIYNGGRDLLVAGGRHSRSPGDQLDCRAKDRELDGRSAPPRPTTSRADRRVQPQRVRGWMAATRQTGDRVPSRDRPVPDCVHPSPWVWSILADWCASGIKSAGVIWQHLAHVTGRKRQCSTGSHAITPAALARGMKATLEF